MMFRVEEEIAEHYRCLLDQHLQSLPEFPEQRFRGRGIVLCGGGNVYFPSTWVCVRVLRRLGCTLPIELWHRGPREMTAEMKALIEPYDVVFKDAFAVARNHPVRRLDGWEIKPYAILNSDFAEVLYIDVDNVPLRNPEFLFDADLYQQTGSLFWPDVPDAKTDDCGLKDVAWQLLGLPFISEPEFEAGQLLIDKRRCWRPLQLTLHLNEHSDYYYSAFFGDKDTFHLAWRRLEQPFGMIPHLPAALSGHVVLVQFDPDGKRLFQHRCNAKWTTDKNYRIPGFVFEEECLAFMRELRQRYPSGFAAPSRSPGEQIAFDQVVATRTFRSQADGRDTGNCAFHADLTLNWNDQEFSWNVESDHEGEAVLIIAESLRRVCFLRQTSSGSWAGRWRYGDRWWLELSPR